MVYRHRKWNTNNKNGLPKGTYYLRVSKYQSGNLETKYSFSVNNPLSNLTINNIKNLDTNISGKCMSGATVSPYINGKQIGKNTTVASNGTYKITIPKQKLGTKVVVKISKSGYVTSEKTITVRK